MRFDGGRNGCRAAKQSWWNMLLAAAGMQKSRPGSCWRQVQAGSAALPCGSGSPSCWQWGVCSPAPALHGSCWADRVHAEQQKCHLLVVRACIHASTQNIHDC